MEQVIMAINIYTKLWCFFRAFRVELNIKIEQNLFFRTDVAIKPNSQHVQK